MGAAAAIYFPDSLIDRNLGTGIRMVLLRTAGERGRFGILGLPAGVSGLGNARHSLVLAARGPGGTRPASGKESCRQQGEDGDGLGKHLSHHHRIQL